ncbi:hypothetical protein, partial [Mesorhizobium sp.]|uniref:hypothetical protein n=1 Tax=Mesorhizobium sp. TaxID=1871066 RepID=UPI00345DD418
GYSIQERIDRGERISVWCHRPTCGHHADLDLVKLRDKLGPDHGAMHDDLVPKLRCSKCGGKNVGIIIHVDTSPTSGLASPFKSYRKAKGD